MDKKEAINIIKTKEEPRDYLFDNMRAILIILVVWGHVLTSMIFDYNSIKIVYYFLFFFHMPALAFISGYFSKNLDKIRSSAFVNLLIPYLILNVFNYLFKIYIVKEPYFSFRFFRPYWGLWYLLALFLWKFFLKDLVKIRFLLPLSFLVGTLSGFSKEFSEYLALGRVVCYLPFFILGYYCTREHIEKLRKIPKLISAAVVAAIGILSVYIVKADLFEVEVFYLRKPYPEASDVKYMCFRILVYAVAVIMTAALINLISSKKCFLSKLGANTMTVYILHLFTIPLLEKLKILENKPYIYLIYSVFMTALIVFVYASPFVKNIYDKGMDMLVRLFLKKDRA